MSTQANASIITCIKCRGAKGYKEEMIPIVSFGDPNVPFMLLSLNPSYNEYDYSPPPLSKLPSGALRNTLTYTNIEISINEQFNYFKGNYYKKWFDDVELFLNLCRSPTYGPLSFGIASKKANVTNIDIFKCPTNPIWRDLDKQTRQKYLNNCAPFLINQLQNTSLKCILVNGSGAYSELKKVIKNSTLKFKASQPMKVPILNNKTSCKVYNDQIIDTNGRTIYVTGTSQRISSDHRGQFGHLGDRSKVAILLSSNLI